MFARLQSTLSLRESGGQTRNKKYSSKRSREPSIFFASSNDLYLLGSVLLYLQLSVSYTKSNV